MFIGAIVYTNHHCYSLKVEKKSSKVLEKIKLMETKTNEKLLKLRNSEND